MALKIRRGSDAVRQTITPSEGELLYTTDTKKLYVGDGSALGGTRVSSGVNTGTAFGIAYYPSSGDIVSSTENLTWSDVTNILKVNSGTFTVTTGGGSARSLLNINTHYNQAYAGSLVFNKSRGSETVPSQLISGDVMGSLTWNGYINGGYQAGTTISSNVAGIPGNPGTPFNINYTSKTGTGPYYVTFSIPSQTAPGISKAYTIAGNSNDNYNGSYHVSASSATSMTLIYATDPGVFGTGTTTASLDPILTTDLNMFTSTSNGNRHKTLRVFNNGQIYVGPIITDFTGDAYDSSWTGQLHVTSTSSSSTQTTAAAQVALRTYTDITQSQSLNIVRYRGTVVTPLAVQQNDQVFNIKYLANDGTAPRNIAQIITTVDGPVSAGVTPGAIAILTTSATGVLTQAVKIDSTQTSTFYNIKANGLQLINPNYVAVTTTGTYALSTTLSQNILYVTGVGATATLTLPPSPRDGQVCSFSLTDDVTLAVGGTPTVLPTFAGLHTAGSVFSYVFRSSNSIWYRIG